jgi:UPF0716 protein FxsA
VASRRYLGAKLPHEQTIDDQGAAANIAMQRLIPKTVSGYRKKTYIEQRIPMNVAKWLLLTLLALPLAELAAFIAVAATIGFALALGLVLASSFAGVLVLRHAGGNHIARIRGAMGEGSFTALQADSTGGFVLLAGILLLVPGFITSVVGLMTLFVPLWRAVSTAFGRAPPARADGVVDLEPEQWHRVDDPALPGRGRNER